MINGTGGRIDTREDSEKRRSLVNLQRVVRNPTPVASNQGKAGKISVASKQSANDGKTLNITVLRNQKPRGDVLKMNSSVEETRDGSIIFVGNRKNTVERVRAKRESTSQVTAKTGQDDDKSLEPQKNTQKSKTKVLIAAH